MRLSGFVWFNVPVLVGMSFIPNQTIALNMFFQWANQTYNAGLNYGNRNASTPYTSSDLAQGYIGACVASMGSAAVLRTIFAKQLKGGAGPRFILLQSVLNYISVASAGFLNCALMRYKETKDGIDVSNAKGDVIYGKSRAAGTEAVKKTGLSRAFLPIMPVCIPGVTVALLMTMRLYPKSSQVQKIIEISLCTAALTLGLPMSIALFKPTCILPRSAVEPELQKILRPAGVKEVNPSTEVYDE